MSSLPDRSAVEARYATVFSHLGLIAAYARRRGSADPDAIAAETMAIAWRRLANVPGPDPRPWLVATARNLLLAERRRRGAPARELDGLELEAPAESAPSLLELDHELAAALAALPAADREAILLVAWDDLTPTLAAKSLGISAVAFRVRLHRARRRLQRALADPDGAPALEPRRPSLERT